MKKGDIFNCKTLKCNAVVIRVDIHLQDEHGSISTLTCYGDKQLFTIQQNIDFIVNDFNMQEEICSLKFEKVIANTLIQKLEELL